MARMSYVVLARKYRPRRFAEMVGQDAVVTALTHALEQQRLHHAYLFTGTRGIGKTTVSRILAKSLNCTGENGQGGITASPCGVCSACTEIDADRYIDYIELDAASNRGIDEIRDLLERAAYKPSVGRFKIFMVDEAHQLTKDSFNALLKTLEEPPEYLKFVLATTDPDKMLPTVLSRCLQFNLRPMDGDTVGEHLRHVLAQEQVTHDDASIRLLARAARGSMRDALSLTDQAIAYGGGALAAASVRAMLGGVDRGHAQGFVRALAARDGRAVLDGVDALRSHGLSAAGALEELATLLQQMAIEQAVPGALPETDPDTPTARELAALMPADETQLLYSFALHGRQELTLAPDAHAGLAMVLLRLLAFSPGGGGAPARAAPPPAADAGKRPTSAAAAPAAAPRTAIVAEQTPATYVTPLGDRWQAAVAMLVERQSIAALVRELAMQAQLVEQQEGAQPLWRLRVERDSLRAPALTDKLRGALAEALEIAPLQLQVEAGAVTDSPARREAAERERRLQEAETLIRNDPLVKEMLAQFSTARIVPGSIKPHY
jgi:DNA polymerase III subunit gamma/tau